MESWGGGGWKGENMLLLPVHMCSIFFFGVVHSFLRQEGAGLSGILSTRQEVTSSEFVYYSFLAVELCKKTNSEY